MDQRPITAAELLALPAGPEIGSREVASGVRAPVIRATVAFYSWEDEIISATDSDGVGWMLGQYADGSWFKRRTN